jgi:NAD+ synthase (glutamine-hydrolysing)
VEVTFDWPAARPKLDPPSSPWERSAHKKEEELTRAISLGLFDYLRKSRSDGFVVSLSGGADSAACACLVSTMCGLALAELGVGGVRGRLDRVEALADAESAREMTRALLTTIYQSTVNSSQTTEDAARDVARAIGADHLEIDVEPLVHGYVSTIERALGRKLQWESDDLALQNIQARARGPGAWLVANLKNALLLATSNRSEAAVGYATMDGDTCGGLSPIAGVDKAFLRRWLRWMESDGPHGLGPIPGLRSVNAQAPTAELRPPQAWQTDEGDLMPYPVLDTIERAAVRDKRAPVEVLELLRVRYPDVSGGQLRAWIRRFYTLWSRNQWKRER